MNQAILNNKRKKILQNFFIENYKNKGISIYNDDSLRKIKEALSSKIKMKSYTYNAFKEFILKTNLITTLNIDVKNSTKTLYKTKYFDEKNFFSKNVEISSLLVKHHFISHYSAMYYYKLTYNEPKNFYITQEVFNPPYKKELSQEDIFRGMTKKYKETNVFASNKEFKIYKIHGIKTNNFGLKRIKINNFSTLISSIERLMLEMIIRPNLCGGINEVINAYKVICSDHKNEINVEKIKILMRKMNLKYPYHQAIGFLLEQFNCNYKKLYTPDTFNNYFFLFKTQTNELNNLIVNKKWKIYIPRELKILL